MSVYTVIDNIEKGYKRNTLGSTDYLPSRDKIFFDFNYKKPQPILCINKKHTREERLSSYLDIEVNGKSFKIPIELKHVAENIEDAKEILDYADDWDDESAIATDGDTFERAVSFIIEYAVFVYEKFSVILTAPYIDILRDGSVSVHWESGKNAQLLIIFKKEKKQLAYYYAEQGERKIPLKSAIVPGDPVDETLARWMRNFLH